MRTSQFSRESLIQNSLVLGKDANFTTSSHVPYFGWCEAGPIHQFDQLINANFVGHARHALRPVGFKMPHKS